MKTLAPSAGNNKNFEKLKKAAKYSKKIVAEYQGRIYHVTLRACTPQDLKDWSRKSPWLEVINGYLSRGEDIGDLEMVHKETGRSSSSWWWWARVHMDDVWKKPVPNPRQPGPRF